MRLAPFPCTLLLAIAVPASATMFSVTTGTDDHDKTPGDGICETQTGNATCTLRAAIEEASALGGTVTVDVPARSYVLSVTGACDGVALCVTGTPTITLTGAGAATTIVDADAMSHAPSILGRVFEVQSAGATVTASGITFTNGASQPPFPGGMAGGVRNTGTLTLVDCVVSNSSGGYGGGIYNSGTLTLTRTVVSGNTALISYASGGGMTNDGGTVTLTQTAFRNNHAHSNGGGIFNAAGSGAGIAADGCEISGNVCDAGGAGLELNNFSVTTLTNTTVSGNMAGSSGGGILLYDSAVVNLNNVTITANVAATSTTSAAGGGISSSAIVNVKNTIIAGNTDDSGNAPDCSAPLGLGITSQGYNLIGDATNCTGVGAQDITGVAAHLDVLAPNGNADGPTQTHALLAGSPAIDGGNPATPGSGGDACLAADQRGVARDQPGDNLCDIGAYEAVPRPTTTTTTTTSTSATTTTVTTTTTTTTSTTQPTTTTVVASTSTTTSSTSTTVTVATTSSTAVTAPATTTTTEPGCGAAPEATFVSIDCRLAALSARLAGASALGKLAPKLMHSVDVATAQKVDAEGLCRASNLKKARKRLQQAAKTMSQYAHRLSALNARKAIKDPNVREDFLSAGKSIQQDLGTLRGSVRCPDDAPPA
jgi:hypothetical protein